MTAFFSRPFLTIFYFFLSCNLFGYSLLKITTVKDEVKLAKSGESEGNDNGLDLLSILSNTVFIG